MASVLAYNCSQNYLLLRKCMQKTHHSKVLCLISRAEGGLKITMRGLKKFMGGLQPPSASTFQRPCDVVNHYTFYKRVAEKDVFFELRVALKEPVSDKANFSDYLHFEVKT